jgi:hypothetical protein
MKSAARTGMQVDWKRTHIAAGLGAAETQPYARDAAIAGVHRHNRLHKLLDQMLCDSDIVQGEYSYRLHAALDAMLDSEPSSEEQDSEEQEPYEESESEEEEGDPEVAPRKATRLNDKILDALERMSRKSRRLRSSDARRSVAHDAAPRKVCLCFMNGALDQNSYKKFEHRANRRLI